ncbi:hypothetical protein GLA29479_2481 [Lysobacter antibioticus]|nr:hypothetical protein GLA29479_2481 [Lysobacter antibioticus]
MFLVAAAGADGSAVLAHPAPAPWDGGVVGVRQVVVSESVFEQFAACELPLALCINAGVCVKALAPARAGSRSRWRAGR